MKPLARATQDWRLHGIAEVVIGVVLAAVAAVIHSPVAIAEAAIAGAIFGLFIWVLVFRHVLSNALSAGPAPDAAPRETDADARRRAIRVNVILAVVMGVLTLVAGGTGAGILLGVGSALVLIAQLLAPRERETGLHVLYEPRLLRRRAIHEELYVEPA